jgi:tetratricopeptide (TPR) repeat protein
LLELGLLYTNTRNYGEALASFERLERTFPGSESAIRGSFEKGLVYQSAGELEKARAQFAAVSEKNRGGVYGDKSLIGLGIVHREGGNYDLALAAFTEVAGRRTDQIGAEAQYRIGETLHQQGKYRDAVTALLRVKYIYPSSADWVARAYLMIGGCYESIQEKGKAREAYQMVLKSHKEDEFAREADRKIKELQ